VRKQRFPEALALGGQLLEKGLELRITHVVRSRGEAERAVLAYIDQVVQDVLIRSLIYHRFLQSLRPVETV
jgi:hypothetical protein